jgi:general nucleoside transport system ATP-binding protein
LSAESLLSLRDLGKRFGSLQALEGVSLDVGAGTVQCLLGENGAGKSTLCNLIFGVYEPSVGSMTFDGEAWQPRSPAEALERGIAMVHQHFSLVPRMTVVENLMLGQVRGMLKRHEFGARIRDIAESFGFILDPDAVVGELSVGASAPRS